MLISRYWIGSGPVGSALTVLGSLGRFRKRCMHDQKQSGASRNESTSSTCAAGQTRADSVVSEEQRRYYLAARPRHGSDGSVHRTRSPTPDQPNGYAVAVTIWVLSWQEA